MPNKTHKPNSRLVAWRALGHLRAGNNLPEALTLAGLLDLPVRERAFTRRLAQHAVRHQRRLQAENERLLRRKPNAECLDLLQLGAAQIEMADIPDHAAVNTTVDLATERQKSLVNAILRQRLRNKPEEAQDWAERYSFPEWLFQRLKADWRGELEAVLQSLNQEPQQVLRVNRRKQSRQAYAQALMQAGIPCRPVAADALVLDQSAALESLPGFADGAVSLQGPAAQQAVELLELADGLSVLDACAAPGGKTAHILERADVHCDALDIEEQRLPRLRENLQRLGLQAQVYVRDASKQDLPRKQYERILLDAPCSGTGVIGRHPDIKYLRREGDIAELQTQQNALLDRLWSHLSPGGVLLYATCSLLTAENDQIIEGFVARHDDVQVDKITLCAGQASAYGWRIAPHHGPAGIWEGFYYARLRKQSS